MRRVAHDWTFVHDQQSLMMKIKHYTLQVDTDALLYISYSVLLHFHQRLVCLLFYFIMGNVLICFLLENHLCFEW